MKSLLAVFVGGIFGTGARLLIDGAIPHADSGFPTSTLIINVAGSAVLGFLVARVWPTAAPWVRAGVGTGILGSFTTFSAVMVALVTLTDGGRMLAAALYLALSLVLGFAAATAGLRLGAALASRTRAASAGRGSAAPARDTPAAPVPLGSATPAQDTAAAPASRASATSGHHTPATSAPRESAPSADHEGEH